MRTSLVVPIIANRVRIREPPVYGILRAARQPGTRPLVACGGSGSARSGDGIPPHRSTTPLRRTVLATLLALAAALTLADPAAAHRTKPLDPVHELRHAIRDTNLLRRDNDRPPFTVEAIADDGDPADGDEAGDLTEEEALAAELRLWKKRFNRELKRSFWWDLHLCESNGNWRMKGRYHGGFSFHPETWAAHRGKWLPKRAFRATRAEQLRVARRVLKAQGWARAWPSCSKKIGVR
jgi:hypothetical protein